MGCQRYESSAVTLGDVVEAVIEVSEDEREAVAVVVHLLESGRVRRALGSKRSRRRSRSRDAAMRKAG